MIKSSINLIPILVLICVNSYGNSDKPKINSFFPDSVYSKYLCAEKVLNLFRSHLKIETLSWQQVGSQSYSKKVFRTPLNQIGHWIEIIFEEQGKTISVSEFSEKSTTIYEFGKNCKETKEVRAPIEIAKIKSPEIAFGDAELREKLASGKSGVIYIWSPRMPYSVTDFKKFQNIARKLNLEFIPVLSPNVSFEEANQALLSQSLSYSGRKLTSIELYMRNATLHFPSMFIFCNKKLNPKRIIGIYKSEDFENIVNRYLLEIK